MKRTFKKSELEGQRGYVASDNTLRIYPMMFSLHPGGNIVEGWPVVNEDTWHGDEPLTGEPLVAALRERGVEVVEDVATEANAKPEVKPTEADHLRKELDEAKGTINRLRDSLTKAENDRLQPPMSDERLLQEAAIAAMKSLLIRGWVGDDSGEKPTPYAEGVINGEQSGEIGCDDLASDAKRAATALLSALKRKEQQ